MGWCGDGTSRALINPRRLREPFCGHAGDVVMLAEARLLSVDDKMLQERDEAVGHAHLVFTNDLALVIARGRRKLCFGLPGYMDRSRLHQHLVQIVLL